MRLQWCTRPTRVWFVYRLAVAPSVCTEHGRPPIVSLSLKPIWHGSRIVSRDFSFGAARLCAHGVRTQWNSVTQVAELGWSLQPKRLNTRVSRHRTRRLQGRRTRNVRKQGQCGERARTTGQDGGQILVPSRAVRTSSCTIYMTLSAVDPSTALGPCPRESNK